MWVLGKRNIFVMYGSLCTFTHRIFVYEAHKAHIDPQEPTGNQWESMEIN